MFDNGSWVQAQGTTSWVYNLNTMSLKNGWYAIKARAWDGSLYSDIKSIYINIFNNHKPNVEIIYPKDKEKVSGKIIIEGISWDEDGNETIQRVEVRIDGGKWIIVNGTTSWNYTLNTKKLKDGFHKLEVRAFDGHLYGNIFSIKINVKNKKVPGFGFITIIVAIAILIAYIKKRN